MKLALFVVAAIVLFPLFSLLYIVEASHTLDSTGGDPCSHSS